MSNASCTIQLETEDGLLFVGFYPKLEQAHYEELYRAVNANVSREEAARVLQDFAAQMGRMVVIE